MQKFKKAKIVHTPELIDVDFQLIDGYYDMGQVYLFGRRYSGESVCALVGGFKWYFYMRLTPSVIDSLAWIVGATNKCCRDLLASKDARIYRIPRNYWEHYPFSSGYSVVEKNVLDQQEGHPLVKLVKFEFACAEFIEAWQLALVDTMQKLRCNYGMEDFKVELYEADVDAKMRFFADMHISGCAWIHIGMGVKTSSRSHCDVECEVQYEQVREMSGAEVESRKHDFGL